MRAVCPRRRSAPSTGRRPSAIRRSTTRASAPSQPTASTWAVTGSTPVRADSQRSGRSPEAELLVARRPVLERLPRERTTRATDADLEPGHDEGARGASLVSHADRAVALATLDDRLVPRPAVALSVADAVAGAEADLEQGAVYQCRLHGRGRRACDAVPAEAAGHVPPNRACSLRIPASHRS